MHPPLSFVLLSIILFHAGVDYTNADINWPEYSQQCRDDSGSPYADDEETYNGGKYHDGSAAYPVLQGDGECALPMQNACQSRPSPKTAYLEGPIDCGGNGWYCRIHNDEENDWPNINLNGDLNFGNCNSTDAFEDAGYDRDGHCHGSDNDSTYYWWLRDHWFRQYNGRVRCCCGWFEGGSQPLYSRRIANGCDYRRHVTSSENLENCRDANEDHGMGFDDIGCDPAVKASQLNEPIPEDDNMCWEIKRFGYTEDGPNTPPTDPPPVSSPVSAPNPSPVVPPPVTSAPSPDEGDDEAGDDDEDEDDYYFPCEDSPLDMVLNIGRRNCDWVAENRDRCERAALASHCPVTCDVCDQCSDSRKRFVLEDGRRKKCSYFERNPDQCEEQSGVTETCRDACGFCGE